MRVQMVNHAIPKYHYSPIVRPSGERDSYSYSNGKNLKESTKSEFYFYDLISFGKKQGVPIDNWSVKGLYKHKIPCMYCGRTLIPKATIKRLNNEIKLAGPASEVVEILKPFEKSLHPTAHNVFQIIKYESARHPDKNLQELFTEIAPKYKERLRNKQYPIFRALKKMSKNLPAEYQLNFKLFMGETDNRLKDLPINFPFSPKEFAYKLSSACPNTTNKKTIDSIVAIAKSMPRSNGPETQKIQLEQLNLIQSKLEKFPPEEKETLNSICELMNSQINKERVILPFNRKSFLYDLENKVLIMPPDNTYSPKVMEKFNKARIEMLCKAVEIPTSHQSVAAFIVKHEASPAEDIVYNLLGESFATIEHILPYSKNGLNHHSNYGHACAHCNNQRRGSLDLDEFIAQNKKIIGFIQEYVNRLVDLANGKEFKDLNIGKKHIFNIKEAIYCASDKKIEVNVAKLNN